jgi:hypothetical protein
MGLLLIGVLVWLGLGPAILGIMAVVYLCTRSQSDHAVAPVNEGQLGAIGPVELDREAA